MTRQASLGAAFSHSSSWVLSGSGLLTLSPRSKRSLHTVPQRPAWNTSRRPTAGLVGGGVIVEGHDVPVPVHQAQLALLARLALQRVRHRHRQPRRGPDVLVTRISAGRRRQGRDEVHRDLAAVPGADHLHRGARHRAPRHLERLRAAREHAVLHPHPQGQVRRRPGEHLRPHLAARHRLQGHRHGQDDGVVEQIQDVPGPSGRRTRRREACGVGCRSTGCSSAWSARRTRPGKVP